MHLFRFSRNEDDDSGIRHKIVRILEEIPDQFELGEDEGDILKLVLDQGRTIAASLNKGEFFKGCTRIPNKFRTDPLGASRG